MNLNIHPLTEINQKATHTLFQTLGVVDALRFFNQFTVGSGDYTKEREQWLGELTLDQIVEEIRVLTPPELIASKVTSFISRYGKAKSWTDRRDLTVLLQRFPELKEMDGEVKVILSKAYAEKEALEFWNELVPIATDTSTFSVALPAQSVTTFRGGSVDSAGSLSDVAMKKSAQ